MDAALTGVYNFQLIHPYRIIRYKQNIVKHNSEVCLTIYGLYFIIPYPWHCAMMEQETAVLNYAVLLFCSNLCLPDEHYVTESGVFNTRQAESGYSVAGKVLQLHKPTVSVIGVSITRRSSQSAQELKAEIIKSSSLEEETCTEN